MSKSGSGSGSSNEPPPGGDGSSSLGDYQLPSPDGPPSEGNDGNDSPPAGGSGDGGSSNSSPPPDLSSSPPDSGNSSPPSNSDKPVAKPPEASNSGGSLNSPPKGSSSGGSSNSPPGGSDSGSGNAVPPDSKSGGSSGSSPPVDGNSGLGNSSPPAKSSSGSQSPPVDGNSGSGNASPPEGSNSGSSPPSDQNLLPPEKSSQSPPDSSSEESQSPPESSNGNSSPPTDGQNGGYNPPESGLPPSNSNKDSPSNSNKDSPSHSNNKDTPSSDSGSSSSSSQRSSNHVPSPPSKNSNSEHSHTPISNKSFSKSSNDSLSGEVVGATVAGIVIISLVALFFLISRRKKKRRQREFIPYRTPESFSIKTGVNSGGSQEFYSGKPPQHNSTMGSSYGSYRGGAESGGLGGSQSFFSYEEMMDITNGFSQQNLIGQGGFGSVHKGFLPDGREVAIKQLSAGSGQGEREFRAEVEIISRVHHRHLVTLVGYCIAEHHRLLVYEFVPNNTLEHHLHGRGVPVLDWAKRVRVAIGAARGLAYLHEDCHPKIIHRDIKSANILLDNAYEAQVADFGLAKLSNDTHAAMSTRVMGTFGYMAPEYAQSGKLTDRSDVYSFGVMLLELVTGRKPVDPSQPMGDESLAEWARPVLNQALETGNLAELTDPRLERRYVEGEVFRMIEAAAACIRHSAQKRPRMVQVLRALDTEDDMPDLSNGVKYGQSTILEAGQKNADLQNFRRMAFGGSMNSGEYSTTSGEFINNSREIPIRPPPPISWRPGDSSEYTSGESETRPINPSYSKCRY